MHHTVLPKESELLFISALTWGASGALLSRFAKLHFLISSTQRGFSTVRIPHFPSLTDNASDSCRCMKL
jgi:hypothetical protein